VGALVSVNTTFTLYIYKKMAKHGKKRQEAAKAVDLTKAYSLNEAVALLKKIGYTKFDASVEIAVKTNADAKYNDQMMRGTTILPHGTGKTKKIAVFTDDEKTAKEA
jgi:large subunit ribosomal protein L1